jgi:hypothetical protein
MLHFVPLLDLIGSCRSVALAPFAKREKRHVAMSLTTFAACSAYRWIWSAATGPIRPTDSSRDSSNCPIYKKYHRAFGAPRQGRFGRDGAGAGGRSDEFPPVARRELVALCSRAHSAIQTVRSAQIRNRPAAVTMSGGFIAASIASAMLSSAGRLSISFQGSAHRTQSDVFASSGRRPLFPQDSAKKPNNSLYSAYGAKVLSASDLSPGVSIEPP